MSQSDWDRFRKPRILPAEMVGVYRAVYKDYVIGVAYIMNP